MNPCPYTLPKSAIQQNKADVCLLQLNTLIEMQGMRILKGILTKLATDTYASLQHVLVEIFPYAAQR